MFSMSLPSGAWLFFTPKKNDVNRNLNHKVEIKLEFLHLAAPPASGERSLLHACRM